MPTPNQYPTVDLGGPIPTRYQLLNKSWPTVLGPKYAGGGQDSFLASTTPSEITWEFAYEDLDPWESDLLDAHNDSAYDTHLAFSFRDPDTGTLWAGVKCLEYQRGSREKAWLNKRVVRLVWRP